MVDTIKKLTDALNQIEGVSQAGVVEGGYGLDTTGTKPEVLIVSLKEDVSDQDRCLAEVKACIEKAGDLENLLPEGYRVVRPGHGRLVDVTPR
ncbi:hypothetical protein [Thalassobaculum salexigens]|uniref:hypothetical protein n=1 Tax=Thalassobaculum salexigens TaxID=455360 RepID=UPI0012ECB619|nr:hypothetical protein [Thalassobaculum salexigens]